jgi:hypothetical protein
MPTYYNGCGAVASDYPEGEDVYVDGSCESCESCDEDSYDEDYDSRPSIAAAQNAASYAANLPDSLIPDMRVPQVQRAVSCEWEGSSGVATASQACGLLASGAESEYHSDGTCDGEVVFGYLRLWDPYAAKAYGRSVAAIDYLRTSGDVRVGFNAGHHIHVAARDSSGRGFSPNALVSLYSVYSHCEDLLYRFAAAGWSQHRTEASGGYSEPLQKLDQYQERTARNVGNAIGGDRYQGLNVTPYLERIQGCRCGAYRFGEWESCECGEDRMTIEWRLWNASVSPRKIRAYIAISAVLTDYAASVDVRDVSKLVENPFQGTGLVDEDSLARQLDYLATRPGFTARDREDLYWLATISPGMGSIGRAYEDSRGEMIDYRHDPSPIHA